MKSRKLHKSIWPLAITMTTIPAAALAADGAAEVTGAAAAYVANNTWMLVATFLVFIMHLGFAS
ncbi:MAG: ammonium transporter, partial [Desulfotignum sp.]